MLKKLWKGFEYKSHQTTAVNWMLAQEADTELPGGFLCDEMGLGKTMEILGTIKNSNLAETLVVAPLAILKQWTDAALKCKFNVYRFSKNKHSWESVNVVREGKRSIYIVHYEGVKSRLWVVNDRIWNRMIFDEAHRLNNNRSKLYFTVKQLEAEVKWIVTATPIVNTLGDAFSLFSVLGVNEDELPKVSQGLLPLIKKKSLCRTVEELREEIPELPREQETYVHELDFLTKEEETFYRSLHGPLVHQLNILMEDGSDQWEILKLLLLLRELSVHPQVYINARRREEQKTYFKDDWTTPATKFSKLGDLITEQADTHHRWIVFSHFHDEINLLASYLKRLPRVRNVHKYSGKISQKMRDEIVEKSKEPLTEEHTTEVMIVQLQSGSVGLNLQHFDRVAFLSPWWTAALMDQAIGRAIRIGQDKQVEVHHLHLKEEAVMNIDRLMIGKVETKRGLCQWFLGNSSRGNLT